MDAGSSPQPSRSTACSSAPDGTAPITVEVHDEQERPVDRRRLCDVVLGVLTDLALHGAHLDVSLVGVQRITQLNREHMATSGPTDVLAFPLDGPDLLDGPVGLRERGDDRVVEPTHVWTPPAEVGSVLLGDVVVCPEVAESQARASGGAPADELAMLTVHGVLHVLGHDHAEPEERHRMFRLTELLLTRRREAA